MDLRNMEPEERAKIDMCKCGHSRADHGEFGGACRKCALPNICSRFTWSHFDEPPEEEGE